MRFSYRKRILIVLWLFAIIVVSGVSVFASPPRQEPGISLPADLKPITPSNAAQLTELAHYELVDSSHLATLHLADPYAADSSWLLATALYGFLPGTTSSVGKVAIASGTQVVVANSTADVLQRITQPPLNLDLPFPRYYAVNVDGTKLAITNLGQITLLDMNTNKTIQTFMPSPDTANFQQAFFSPDGTLLASVTYNHTTGSTDTEYPIDIFNVASGEVTTLSGCGSECSADVAFSPDGKWFAASPSDYTNGAVVKVWSIPDGNLETTLKLSSYQLPTGLAFTPDSRVLAVANSDGVFITDVASGKTLAKLSSAQNVSFSPDGLFLLTSTYDSNANDNTLHFWGTSADGGPMEIPPTAVPVATVVPAATSEQPATAVPTQATLASATCTVMASRGANLRTGPGTTFARAGALAAGASQSVIGQAKGGDGFVWWKLDNDSWVRSDLVQTAGDCTAVPAVSS